MKINDVITELKESLCQQSWVELTICKKNKCPNCIIIDNVFTKLK